MKKICLMLVVAFMLSVASSVFACATSLSCASFSKGVQTIVNGVN